MPEAYSYPVSSESLAMLASVERDAAALSDQITLVRVQRLQAAALSANSGDTSRAVQVFLEEWQQSDDLRVLFVAFQLLFRTGDLASAERITRKRVAISRSLGTDACLELARALGNLSLILCTQSRLDEAQKAAEDAIVVDRSIPDPRGLSRDMANLAMVFEARAGEPADHALLDQAESVYRESLQIAQAITPPPIDLIATKFANLGDIAMRRLPPRIDEARDLWTRAEHLFQQLGNTRNAQELRAKIALLVKS